jgi:predicted nicotinamide N-methyase
MVIKALTGEEQYRKSNKRVSASEYSKYRDMCDSDVVTRKKVALDVVLHGDIFHVRDEGEG